MNASAISILVTTLVFGAAILGSYVPIYQDQRKGVHDYWVGMPQSTQFVFYGIWILSALGFIWYILSLFIFPDKQLQGLFSYGSWIRPTLIATLLFGSLLWSVFVLTYYRHNWKVSKPLASISLIIVALPVLFLLAGEAENNAPWHRILGLLLFAITTVLIDPVMWNARWILYA